MKHLYRLARRGDAFALTPVDLEGKEVFVLDLLQDRQGNLWIATATGLFCRQSDGVSRHYTRRDGLPDEMIHDLFEDHLGHLWVATRSAGFFRFDQSQGGSQPIVAAVYNKQHGLPTDWVFQLFETSDQRFWVATNAGLIEFLGEGVWWKDEAAPDKWDVANAEARAAENGLPALDSPQQLAEALGLTVAELRWLAYHREAATRIHYYRFTIPKRDGSTRPIWAPLPKLKASQSLTLNRLECFEPAIAQRLHGAKGDNAGILPRILHVTLPLVGPHGVRWPTPNRSIS